jgi:hypothetical protein
LNDSKTPRPARLGEPSVASSRSGSNLDEDAPELTSLREFSGARIVLPHEGGSLRTIITGTKKHATGVLSSRKTGFRQYWEGFPERMMILESEVDHRVVDYQTQPFRFEFVHNGRPWVYIADHCRQLRDGTVEVIEVKRTALDLRDPEYTMKLSCVNDLCREMGWDFKVAFLSKHHLREQRRKNLEIIHSRRFASVDRRHQDVLTEHKQTQGSVSSFRDLGRQLAPNQPQRADAIIQALIAQGTLAVDLDRPLAPNTPVHIVEPALSITSVFRI